MIKFIDKTTGIIPKYFSVGNLHTNTLYQYIGKEKVKNLQPDDIVYITSNDDKDDRAGMFYLVIVNRTGWDCVQPVNIEEDKELKFVELPYDLKMIMESQNAKSEC